MKALFPHFRGAGGPQGRKVATRNSIRFADMASSQVIYSEKPNAFLMVFEVIFAFWTEFLPFSIACTRYFDRLFRMLKKAKR